MNNSAQSESCYFPRITVQETGTPRIILTNQKADIIDQSQVGKTRPQQGPKSESYKRSKRPDSWSRFRRKSQDGRPYEEEEEKVENPTTLLHTSGCLNHNLSWILQDERPYEEKEEKVENPTSGRDLFLFWKKREEDLEAQNTYQI